jgi:hypothetical protein
MADVAMAENQAIARYRRWYRRLLRFYARPHRERFAESMEPPFYALCRERAGAGKGLGGFVLGMFVETLTGIIRENGRSIVMQHNSLLRIALVSGCILLVPLLGNLFMGWSWPWFAFPAWGAVLFGTGLAYELIARKGGTMAYRAAVGIACLTGFVLVFINAAVGIIGDGPVNLLYLGVLAVGFAGALIARLQPRGMALACWRPRSLKCWSGIAARDLESRLARSADGSQLSPSAVPPGRRAQFWFERGLRASGSYQACCFDAPGAPRPKSEAKGLGRGASREGVVGLKPTQGRLASNRRLIPVPRDFTAT